MSNYLKVPCPFLQTTDVLTLEIQDLHPYGLFVLVFDFRHGFQYAHPPSSRFLKLAQTKSSEFPDLAMLSITLKQAFWLTAW